MTGMMHSTGMAGSGFFLLWGVHVLSVIVFFTGLLFLILWAAKNLPGAQMKTWGIGLVVAGTVACLFTIGVKGSPWTDGGFGGRKSGMMMQRGMMNQMIEKMEDHDESESIGDHDEMEGMMRMMMGGMGGGDGMEMSMDDMTAMLEGKTGDAFDQAFIEGMIPHHQGAIDMAEMALESAKHEEIKAMARAIITAQQREIDQMEQWMQSWGYNQ